LKLSLGYCKYLDDQCEEIIKAFSNGSGGDLCAKQFEVTFHNLKDDFLPPVDREDIASLSLMLYYICVSAKEYYQNKSDLQKNDLYSQLNLIRQVTKEFMTKRKTCEESIRRLTEKNIVCKMKIDKSKASQRECALNLNDCISDYIKCIVSAYFKNL